MGFHFSLVFSTHRPVKFADLLSPQTLLATLLPLDQPKILLLFILVCKLKDGVEMWSELCHLSFEIQNPRFILLEERLALYMLQNTNVFLCSFPVLSFPLCVDVLRKCVCSGCNLCHHHTPWFEVLLLRQSTPNTLASGTSLWLTQQLSMSPALLRAWAGRKLPSKQTNHYHLRGFSFFFFFWSQIFSALLNIVNL